VALHQEHLLEEPPAPALAVVRRWWHRRDVPGASLHGDIDRGQGSEAPARARRERARSDGKFAWRIVADNGQIVATDGGQGYERA
jgi:hypothetical protein